MHFSNVNIMLPPKTYFFEKWKSMLLWRFNDRHLSQMCLLKRNFHLFPHFFVCSTMLIYWGGWRERVARFTPSLQKNKTTWVRIISRNGLWPLKVTKVATVRDNYLFTSIGLYVGALHTNPSGFELYLVTALDPRKW